MNQFGYLRVGAASLKTAPANIDKNKEEIIGAVLKAKKAKCDVLSFMPMALSSYTIKDMFLYDELCKSAVIALGEILDRTKDADVLFNVGMPMKLSGKLFFTNVILQNGKCHAVYVKEPRSTDYEKNFSPFDALMNAGLFSVDLLENEVPLVSEGSLLHIGNDGFDFNITLMSDNTVLSDASKGTVVLNPSSENISIYGDIEKKTKADFSAINKSVILTSKNGYGEDVESGVFAGGAYIITQGMVKSAVSFCNTENAIALWDIDTTLLGKNDNIFSQVIELSIPLREKNELLLIIEPYPFLPADKEDYNNLLELSSYALYQKMLQAKTKKCVLGVSGGVDSTAALIMIANCFQKYSLPMENILSISMPGFGTTKESREKSLGLAKGFQTTLMEIDITTVTKQHFSDIHQEENKFDVTFENAQARERTQILMDIANKENAIVIGTGDLSEVILGWCTYGGDSLSSYSINHSLPKTLLKDFLTWYSYKVGDFAIAKHIENVVKAPVTPELLPTNNGKLVQKTEDSVGPYDLHDFFIYHRLVNKFSKEKILFMAFKAFEGKFEKTKIIETYSIFAKRIFTQKFKQQAMANGPVFTFDVFHKKLDIPTNIENSLWQ